MYCLLFFYLFYIFGTGTACTKYSTPAGRHTDVAQADGLSLDVATVADLSLDVAQADGLSLDVAPMYNQSFDVALDGCHMDNRSVLRYMSHQLNVSQVNCHTSWMSTLQTVST